MLSILFNIEEFMEKMRGRSFREIIWLTDQEATAAERYLYKSSQEDQHEKIAIYAGCLKDFILYLRYGVRTSTIRNLNLDDFNGLRLH